MSATDELRRLLDERGVEYSEVSSAFRVQTKWQDSSRRVITYEERKDADPIDDSGIVRGLTPEQIVEATLGRGKCHNIAHSEGSWLCSECGAHLYKPNIDRSYKDDDGVRWYSADLQGIGLHFCLNCGREVEK